jgi:CBS domain-containing protein
LEVSGMAQTVHEVVTDVPVAPPADTNLVEAACTMVDFGEVCSGELVTVTPEQPVEEAVWLMRRHALRRLPVGEEGRPVGAVSIGDLALERHLGSALADIGAAEPNR